MIAAGDKVTLTVNGTPVQEPPVGQNNPSTTILALRWPVNMLNSSLASQFVHHLQVKLEFSPENAPNTIKALAFKEFQDD